MPENSPETSHQPPLSLSFDDVVRLRVQPAQFARMVGVSRQTVSCWIRDGKVTLGADGRLDPAKAARQVVENSDPSRLRARVLKAATEDAAGLRHRIAALETQLEGARGRIGYLEEFSRAETRQHEFFITLLKARWEVLRELHVDQLAAHLEMMDETAMYCSDGMDPNDPDDEGGHDPRALLDRELGLDVLDAEPFARPSQTEGVRDFIDAPSHLPQGEHRHAD